MPMIFGFNPPRVSYIGPHSTILSPILISSQLELVNLIANCVDFNKKLGLTLTCIDFSEIQFSPDFFTSNLNENIPDVYQSLTIAQELIARSESRLCIFIPKNYFLGSQIQEIRDKTFKIISKTSEILEALGINYPSIIIRVGSAYGNRKKTLASFCSSIRNMGKSTISRLSIMNDDKPSLFSITDLLTGVFYETGIPLTFRILPHQFNDGGLSIREALFLSCSTWVDKTKPLFIYSESIDYDINGIPVIPKVSGHISHRIPTFGISLDVIIESSSKEDACLEYMMNHKSLPPIIINRINTK